MPRRAATPPLRSQHVEATRRAILDAARASFGTEGYAGASVAAIAAAAGVTKGAVYHHFADKEALFRAVHAEVEDDAQARAMAGRDPALPAVDQMVAMVEGYLDATLDEEIRRITLIDGPALLGLEPEPATPAQQETAAAAQALVAMAIEQGELLDVDPGVLLQLVGGLALQCGLLIARSADPDATRAALGPIVDAMLRGLAPR